MTGNGVRRGNVPGNASAPSVQKSGQFGVVKAATSLQLGDVIKGEISDLTGNEITLTLENNTVPYYQSDKLLPLSWMDYLRPVLSYLP